MLLLSMARVLVSLSIASMMLGQVSGAPSKPLCEAKPQPGHYAIFEAHELKKLDSGGICTATNLCDTSVSLGSQDVEYFCTSCYRGSAFNETLGCIQVVRRSHDPVFKIDLAL